MIALSEGHWLKAEKLLTQSVKDTDTSLINYLAAAQAAQAQNADDRRDNYLRLAHIAEPGAEVAVGLTQAQLQLSNGQLEEALASLTHLQQIAPKHAHVLKLLSQVYKRLGEWGQILAIIPALRKASALTDTDLTELERSAWLGQLEKQTELGAAEGLQSLWASMPKKQRQDDVIAYSYLKGLILVGASVEAEKPLTQRIKKDNSEPFLALYGSLVTDHGGQQLQFVEKLADKFNQSYIWALTAGRLSLREKIWGKAKVYLEQAMALNPTDEAKTLLAIAMDRLGEQQQAYQQMKSGWPAEYLD
jgi:HemY protein